MTKGYYILERHGMAFFKNKKIEETGMFLEAFTTRLGGVSPAPYESLNTGFHTEDRAKNVQKNMERIMRALGISKVYAPRQVHGDSIIRVDEENRTYIKDTEADALMTSMKGFAIAVKCADCIGSIIADPVNKACAAVHSGWRGVANKIIAKTVVRMKEEFGSDPSSLLVSMSPCISRESLTVGAEVYESLKTEAPFAKIFGEDKKEPGKFVMDMWQGNSNLLLEAGVKEENIMVNRLNTFTHPTWFYSHRRDNGKTGRMIYLVSIL